MQYNYTDLNLINQELNAIWPGWNAVRLLGRGSFGAVYEIHRNVRSNLEKAAVKIIRVPENESEVERLLFQGMTWQSAEEYYENYVDSLQNEIRIMQSFVGNSHIVSYEDYSIRKRYSRVGWDLYIRMELLTGLLEFIKDYAFDEKTVVKLGMDIALGLNDCHCSGIIHRDIKPDNIFVNRVGNFKLGDFGVSRSTPGSQDQLSFKGTLGYMAPEVYRMISTDARSDIYSIGMVLYQCLNDNRLPFVPVKFTPDDIEQARFRRFSGEPVPAPVHGSEWLKRAVLKAVAAAPEARFQSAVEMYNELSEIYRYINGFGRRAEQKAERSLEQKAEQNAGPKADRKEARNADQNKMDEIRHNADNKADSRIKPLKGMNIDKDVPQKEEPPIREIKPADEKGEKERYTENTVQLSNLPAARYSVNITQEEALNGCEKSITHRGRLVRVKIGPGYTEGPIIKNINGATVYIEPVISSDPTVDKRVPEEKRDGDRGLKVSGSRLRGALLLNAEKKK